MKRILLVLLVAGVCASQDITVEHRVLLLTTSSYNVWSTGFLKNIMSGYGAPLTVVELDTDPLGDLGAFLWESEGRVGRYSAVVMLPDVEAGRQLTPQQIRDLRGYQRRTGARALKFGAPPAAAGLPVAECSRGDALMRLLPKAPVGVSGVREGAELSAAGVQRCPATYDAGTGQCCTSGPQTCSACTPTPILAVSPRPPPPPGAAAANGTAANGTAANGTAPAGPSYIGGVLLGSGGGRQSMLFFLECDGGSVACYALGHLGLAWAMQNIIPGERRAALSLQVDDVLLSTASDSGATSYRMTPDDVKAHMAWMDGLRATLPEGSSVRPELVFNGNGVLLQSGSPDVIFNVPACFQTQQYTDLGCSCWGGLMASCPAGADWYCRSCTKDWKRVRGSEGVRYDPVPSASGWGHEAFMAGDPLYRLIRSDKRVVDAFLWSSHTFSHQMLDNATYDAVKLQLRLNKVLAGQGFLGINTSSSYSGSSMVTPAISGLFNGDALAAMAEEGVVVVVGDNTWPVLVNQGNPYHMLYTTDSTNGYPSAALGDGPAIAIMPRWSTALSFSASTVQEALDSYNSNAASGQQVASIEDLLWREADRVVREGLLSLRYDGFMFHQANMRVSGSGGRGSLLMMWTDAVLYQLTSVVDWPVISYKLDDLSRLFASRQARDACRLSYRLSIRRGVGVHSVTVTSGAAAGAGGGADCPAPLLVRRGVHLEVNGTRVSTSSDEGARTAVPSVKSGGSQEFRVLGRLPWRLPRQR